MKQLKIKQTKKAIQNEIDTLEKMRLEGFEAERIPGDIVDWDKVLREQIKSLQKRQSKNEDIFYTSRENYFVIKDRIKVLEKANLSLSVSIEQAVVS